MQNKVCAICVYDGVCEGRVHRLDIEDCCIPAAPLRSKQQNTRDAETFIYVTKKYIHEQKVKSAYWRKFEPEENP